MMENCGVMPVYDIGDNNRNNNDGFGDGGWVWVIFLFFLMAWGGNWGNWGGNGMNGANGPGFQGALTRADLCQDMNFGQLENGVRGIQQGLCDGFYAQNTTMLNGFNGLQNTVQNGFAGVDNAICTLGYQTQAGINSVNTNMMQGNFGLQQAINADTVANMQNTNALQAQLAQCCCDNRAGQKDIEYRMATDTCAIQNTIQNTTRDIIDNQNCNSKQILDFLVQDKISTLQSENQSLRLAASQTAQNEYLISQIKPCPVPAYVTCNPWAASYGVGLANGCGCNNGCNTGCY